MAEGYYDFVAGALPSARLEDYCQNQAVMRFASAAARDTALAAVKTEGMMAWLHDTNTLTVYTGSAWTTVGPLHGVLTSWTPAVVQSGSVASTNERSVYTRLGRLIIASFYVTITGTGTANNAITVSLPVNAASTAGSIGTAHFRDNSTGLNSGAFCKLASASTFNLLDSAFGATLDVDAYIGLTGATFDAAIAANDYIMGQVIYDAAADA
jgi:hypothetical protein